MNDIVFIAVVAAALLHATWNAIVKGEGDKASSMVAVVLGHVPCALVALPFVGLPAPASWPWLVAGVLLHAGYQLFLVRAYEIGDLTQVYPIARGSAPLIVALVSVAFLGVTLGSAELIGIGLIAVGIMSIALVRQSDGLANPRAAALALATGGFIAAYSLVDGIGARAAGTAIGFYACLALGNALVILCAAKRLRIDPFGRVIRRHMRVLLVGGGASFLAYALVVWAFTQAPIALVTALRETSIVFALLIGVLHLKERLSLAKVVSTMTTLAGAALLRFAR